MKALKENSNSILISLIELVVGILLLVDPVRFTSGIIAVLGVLAILWGIGRVIRYFRTEASEAAQGQHLSKGLIALLCGILCVTNSQWFLVTVPMLSMVYGVAILVAGITKLQWVVDMLRLKKRRWYLACISAVVSMACGWVIITNPFGTMAVLWTFAGISLIIEAVFDVIAMLLGRRQPEVEDPDIVDSEEEE